MNQRSGSSSDLEALSPWVNELAQTFVSLSSDIALVMDASGVISRVEQSGGTPMAPEAAQWVGRSWADTVTAETRRKIELLLGDVASTGLARRREVSHPGGAGTDIPVAYTAIRLGTGGPVLAVGRDLRAIAAIQQQFLDAQQELERGYWRARQAETRDRALRQVVTDALLVLDAEGGIVRSTNAAAQRLGTDTSPLGRPAVQLFDAHSRAAVDELLVTARSGGRPVELRARLAGAHAYVSVAATPFRVGASQRLLLRLRDPTEGEPSAAERRRLAAPGNAAVVITDAAGHVRACDESFAALVGQPGEAALVGRPLSDWLGDARQPLDVLLADTRREGLAEREGLALRGSATAHGARVSASWLTEGDQEGIGLIVYPGDTNGLAAAPQRAFLQAWEALDGQLGRSSLTQMLREAAALAERHFIQAALQRCGGDVAAAAELLGVSRDTLARRRRGRRTPRQS